MQWNLQSSSWKKIKMERMKARQVLSITLTLFAVFFGAGNMIFPPAMGQQAGEHYIQALAGFIVTDAGIALLGMIRSWCWSEQKSVTWESWSAEGLRSFYLFAFIC